MRRVKRSAVETRLVKSLSKIAEAYADAPIEEGMAAIEAAVEHRTQAEVLWRA